MAELSVGVKSDIDFLTNIYTDTINLYHQLFELDLNWEIGSFKVNEITEKIKYNNGLATIFEERLAGSSEELRQILDYLYTELNIKKVGTITAITGAILPDKELIICRLINKVVKKYLESAPEDLKKLLDTEVDENDEVYQAVLSSFQFATLFSLYVAFDLSTLSLAIMNSDMNRQSYDVKQYLLWGKYCYGFITEDIETYFLNSGFQVEEHPFLIEGMAKKIYNAPDEVEAYYRNTDLTSFLMGSFPKIENMDDAILTFDTTNYVYALLASYAIRTIMVLASDSERESYITMVKERIEEMKKTPAKKACVQLYMEAISCFDKDMMIPQMVSVSR